MNTNPTPQASPVRSGRALPLALGTLTVIAAVLVGLLGWQAISLSRTESDATAALESARTRTAQVLSFDPKTVDADIERARAQVSGTFAAQYDQLVNSVILPSSKEQGMSTKAEVKNAALINSQPDRAEALLLIHQAIASTAVPQPQEGTLQVKVTMTKSPRDGQWLISDLQPI